MIEKAEGRRQKELYSKMRKVFLLAV